MEQPVAQSHTGAQGYARPWPWLQPRPRFPRLMHVQWRRQALVGLAGTEGIQEGVAEAQAKLLHEAAQVGEAAWVRVQVV